MAPLVKKTVAKAAVIIIFFIREFLLKNIYCFGGHSLKHGGTLLKKCLTEGPGVSARCEQPSPVTVAWKNKNQA
jgi:hypothetical protein